MRVLAALNPACPGETSCGQTGTQRTDVLLQMLVYVYADFLQAKNVWLDISS